MRGCSNGREETATINGKEKSIQSVKQVKVRNPLRNANLLKKAGTVARKERVGRATARRGSNVHDMKLTSACLPVRQIQHHHLAIRTISPEENILTV